MTARQRAAAWHRLVRRARRGDVEHIAVLQDAVQERFAAELRAAENLADRTNGGQQILLFDASEAAYLEQNPDRAFGRTPFEPANPLNLSIYKPGSGMIGRRRPMPARYAIVRLANVGRLPDPWDPVLVGKAKRSWTAS